MRVIILKILYPILALSSFFNPLWGVLNYTFISIIRPEQLTYGINKIPHVFAIAIVCLFLSFLVNSKKIFYIKYSFHRLFLLFGLGLYLATLLSPYTDFKEFKGSLYYLQQLPQIMIFCFCLFSLLNQADEQTLVNYVRFLLMCFTFMAVWGIDQRFRGNLLVENLFGTSIVDRCAITGVYCLYLPLPLFFYNSPRLIDKIFSVVSFFSYLAIIIFTQSRAGFLGICVSAIVYVLLARKSIKLYATMAIVCVLFALALPSFYLKRISKIPLEHNSYSEAVIDSSAASRLVLWKLAVRVFMGHPMLGVGHLNFQDASHEYATDLDIDEELYKSIFDSEGRSLQAHNMFVNILAEGGLVTAVPFYLLILMPILKGYRQIRIHRNNTSNLVVLQRLAICGLCGYLVTTIFANMRMLDYMYWNLTLVYLISLKLKDLPREQSPLPAVATERVAPLLVPEKCYGRLSGKHD